ncbi:MAG: electron transport complex protein RnfE [Gammaproteobacteria bacterium]|jgi:electron transport complex protein RnfE
MFEIHRIINPVQQHPVFLATLGVCPLLLKSETLLSGIVISMAYVFVYIFSMITVSSLRKFIPHQSHMIFILLITSTWVTVIDLLLQATIYEMKVFIDIYIPIIAMNSLLLLILQKDALQNSVFKNMKNLLLTPMLIILICSVIGAARELLSQGSLFSDLNIIVPLMTGIKFTFIPDALTFSIFNSAAGAFIVLGCFIAFLNFIFNMKKVL